MNRFKIIMFVLTYFGIIGYSTGQNIPQNEASKNIYSILFIGNSLTYTNNLPKLVINKAKQKGIIVRTKMIAHPNYALIDHWNDGAVQEIISTKKYDFVIIQQGPSSQPYGRTVLIEYGKKISALCKNNGAKLCYFMVWPSLNYYESFNDVISNHTDAATINNALLCPVGAKWKTHFDTSNNFDYYGSDGFHPSMKGSRNAAKIIVASLFE